MKTVITHRFEQTISTESRRYLTTTVAHYPTGTPWADSDQLEADACDAAAPNQPHSL